jgi:hypothetical protein
MARGVPGAVSELCPEVPSGGAHRIAHGRVHPTPATGNDRFRRSVAPGLPAVLLIEPGRGLLLDRAQGASCRHVAVGRRAAIMTRAMRQSLP